MEVSVFLAVITASVLIAIYSRYRHAARNTRDFFVASGQFGAVLVFFLTIGETYSIGSVLGFPAGIYTQGSGFGLWFLGYILLSYPVGYFLNPRVWALGQKYACVTIADIFRNHYASRALEILIVLNTTLFLLPFGEMQFAGLMVVVRNLGWHVSGMMMTGASALLTLAWILLSGIRAPAYVSILKDVLMVVAIVLGGYAAMHAMHWPAALPRLSRPDGGVHGVPGGNAFIVSTIILQSIGLCIAPQTVAFLFSARSPRTVQKNQIFMPLYMLMFPFLFMMALYVRTAGMTPASPNDVFMVAVCATLPHWARGLVAGGCALSALVILAGICLALGPLVSRNLMPGHSDRTQKTGAQVTIAVYLLVSVLGGASLSGLMVMLNNLYYIGVTQLAPGIIVAIFNRRVSAVPIIAGLLCGDLIGISLFFLHVMPAGLNPGMIGLAVNALIVWGGMVRTSATAA
ncbi:sodium:solute symporter [Komagataeibacter oboediens]|uniref:sodium:solute symporter family protein n=1 Tax=Komagataeibacter oboediens TaxID=65958 RepID=UPI0023DBDEC2|nr:sodium:solute symporter [Komagataeibacter oboediens]WEQ51252.1 sodium:solute symporter [Komagataeibacter oboediens]